MYSSLSRAAASNWLTCDSVLSSGKMSGLLASSGSVSASSSSGPLTGVT
jgi:hypothetical protein